VETSLSCYVTKTTECAKGLGSNFKIFRMFGSSKSGQTLLEDKKDIITTYPDGSRKEEIIDDEFIRRPDGSIIEVKTDEVSLETDIQGLTLALEIRAQSTQVNRVLILVTQVRVSVPDSLVRVSTRDIRPKDSIQDILARVHLIMENKSDFEINYLAP
jgi:hypothetical protein